MNQIYIFGEAHTSLENIAYIEKRIKEIKPKVILHELLYGDIALTPTVIKSRLDKCDGSGFCDPKLNKDIYELGLLLKAKLVGIDYRVRTRDMKIQFMERERHMVKLIERWSSEPGPIVVVVGDIHLRQEYNSVLGDASLIYTTFKDLAKIERVPLDLQEAK